MERPLLEHTEKLQQCLDKFDLIFSQVTDLKQRVDGEDSMDLLAGLEKRLNTLEGLGKSVPKIEQELSKTVKLVESSQAQLLVMPNVDTLNRINSSIQSFPQQIEDYLKEVAPGIVAELFEKQLLEKLPPKELTQPTEIKRIDISLDSQGSRIDAIEKTVSALKPNLLNQAVKEDIEKTQDKIAAVISSVEDIDKKQSQNENCLGTISNRLDKMIEWIKDESIRPDIDKLDSDLLLLKNKFTSIESAILNFAKEMVQFDEFESRLGMINNEIGDLRKLLSQQPVRESSADKMLEFEREIEKLKSDVIWGIKEMRQRLDALVSGIRIDLFEEETKRYEKMVRLEVENQKLARIATGLYAEITRIRQLLPAASKETGKLTN